MCGSTWCGWARPCLDEHVAQPHVKAEVGPPLSVQMAEVAPPEPELDPAEAMVVRRDSFPGADLTRDPGSDILHTCRSTSDLVKFLRSVTPSPAMTGRLLTEEVMGFEGFSGLESILYHLESPCRVIEFGEFEPIVRDEWVPDAHAHRHLRTWEVAPAGDAVNGRQLLMWNDDVEISLCRPTEEMDYFFRNGEGDEVIFVHEGAGTLETVFGDLPYSPGDFRVVPRGTTYRFRAEGEQRHLVFETPGLITIPKRYRNEHGQPTKHAPSTTVTSIRRPSPGPTATAASTCSRCGCAAATRPT